MIQNPEVGFLHCKYDREVSTTGVAAEGLYFLRCTVVKQLR